MVTSDLPRVNLETDTNVEVDGGKYRFWVQSSTGRVFADRHGEPWAEINKCSKAMICLIHELAEAREVIKGIPVESPPWRGVSK